MAQEGSTPSHWAHPEAGMPLVESYTPDMYGGETQNWEAIQDKSGLLYIANTSGVLTFDGARWELFPVPNRSIVRGLAQGSDDRIYFGAQNELGYLDHTDKGGARLVSLRDEIMEGPDDLGDIWAVEAVGSDIFFQAYYGIYRWSIDDETMHSWIPEGDSHFFPMTAIRDTVYVGHQGELKYIDGDELRAVASSEGAESGPEGNIRGLAPYGDGSLLVGMQGQPFQIWDGMETEQLSVSFADDLDDALLYSLNRLSDGTYALSTIGAGLFLFDAQGALIRHFPFPDQPVLNTYEDHEGGVWVMLDSGIRRIDWSTPLSIFSGEHADEIVTDVVRHNGVITVGTNHGIGTVEPNEEPGSPAVLQKHAPFAQIWNLHQSGNELIAGTAGDLIRWDLESGYESLGLEGNHAFRISAPTQRPNHLFVSTDRGIDQFEWSETDGWIPGATIRDDMGNFSRQIWADDSTLWAGTRYAGVFRISVDAEGRLDSLRQFTTEDGLPEGHIMPFQFGGSIYFSTDYGAHRFDASREQFEPVTGVPGIGETETRILLADDGQGRWWGNAGEGLGWWSQIEDEWTWQSRSLNRVSHYFIRSVLAEDDVVWLSTNSGLLRYKPQEDTPPESTVLLRGVSSLPADSTLWGTGPAARRDIAYADNSVRIRYAAPSYTMPDATEYRVRLLGLSDTWSNWTTDTQRDFTNLSPGAYTFQVQARTARGQVATVSSQDLRVVPPWYRTWWAYGLYLLGLLGLFVGAIHWRTTALRRQQRYLERLVEDRTTEISHKNEQLAQQAQKLQSLDAAKSQFFANISHEFRTPLTLILGPVRQILQERNSGAPTYRRLSIVERNARRLLHMVQQLLRLTQLESGTLKLQPKRCELGAYMAQYARTLVDLGKQQGITVHVEHTPPPAEAKPAYADTEYIEQVVSNLVGNAIKFTPEGGHVVVRVVETETETRLLVSDTGIGIAQANHDTIFERFQQVDSSSTRNHQGAGIGLALTKDLVEAHGGRITVDSAPDEGSTFTVILPRGFEALPASQRANVPGEGDSEASDSTPEFRHRTGEEELSFTMAPSLSASGDTQAVQSPHTDGSTHGVPEPPTPSETPLVLVVDDNPDMRDYVRSILDADFRVMEAATGNEGFEKAKRHLPDMILADVMMPGMDGMEMTQALRAEAATQSIPIIMLTARADEESELEGLSSGAYDYITKPFDPAVLEMRVRGMLQWMQRLRRRLQAEAHANRAADESSNSVTNGQDSAETATEEEYSKFEKKARAIIQTHITDGDFDVDGLAEEMNMSRTTLYRRARTNNTPSPAALIREVRMEMAHALLVEEEGSVTEVAYAIGYESLASFSDQFRTHFGYPPSQVFASTTV